MGDQVFRENVAAMRDMLPPYEDFRNGTTGVVQANGSYSDASAGLSAPYSWVTLDGNRSANRVVNLRFQRNVAGFQVETAINTKTGEREITRPLLMTYNDFPAEVVDSVIIPGGGGTGVKTSDLLDGKVEPDSEFGGLYIYVRSFQLNGVSFPLSAEDAHYDLSAEVAALTADTGAMALVYVDNADGQITVVMGDEHGLPYAYTKADADAIVLPEDVTPLAGLVLFDGQTDAEDSFVEHVRYFDCRLILNTTPSVLFGKGTTGTGDIVLQTSPTIIAPAFTNTSAVVATYTNTNTSSSSQGAFQNFYSDDGAAMAAGDRLGGSGYGGAEDPAHTLAVALALTAFALEAWTSTAHGAYGRLETTPLGTTVRRPHLFWGVEKVLTNNTSIDLFNVSQASSTAIGLTMEYTVRVKDASNEEQVEVGCVSFAGYNKAGTRVESHVKQWAHPELSTGTLTVTFAISNASTPVISVNANSSLTPSAGFPIINLTLKSFSGQNVTLA